EEGAGGEGDGEGKRRRAGGDGEAASLGPAALSVPRVEGVALRAADAMPLQFDEREVHLDAARRRAVGCDRNRFGVQAALLIDEERRPLDADVPRSRVDEK